MLVGVQGHLAVFEMGEQELKAQYLNILIFLYNGDASVRILVICIPECLKCMKCNLTCTLQDAWDRVANPMLRRNS